MKHSGFMMVATMAVAGTLSTPAGSRSPVNDWFCKVLKLPFDPKAAIAAFPLEKLPPAVESRREKTDDKGKKRTYVEVEAEGEKFTVTYDYAYANDDVTDPYGFGLKVQGEYGDETIVATMDKWLAEWGPPERSSMGRGVYAGPLRYGMAEPFSFERWGASPVYTASWLNRDDMRHVAELCSKKG